MNNKTKGIILMILFALSLSIMSTFLKLAGHMPVAEKTVYRNSIAALFAFIYIVKKHGFKDKSMFWGNRKNILGLGLRTIFGIIGICLNLYALQYLLLPNATIIQDLSIFFVVIFSYVFLGEKIKLWQVILIVIGFIGAVFVVNPDSTKFVLLPSIAAILGAMMNGGDSATMRYLGDKCDPVTLVFFYNFLSSIILLPFMIIFYKPLAMHTIIYLILAGLMYIIVEFTLILAYKYAPARDIALFRYSDIIFSAILGFLVFNKIPSLMEIVGYIIIIVAAILLILYRPKKYA
ncbi:DMT family transporter [Clostridium thermobutyricum]|uniref:DMT family transporter n=1 Tax=Clostridium thermobutyricum TaxID=29372 RepID=UPI003F520B08